MMIAVAADNLAGYWNLAIESGGLKKSIHFEISLKAFYLIIYSFIYFEVKIFSMFKVHL